MASGFRRPSRRINYKPSSFRLHAAAAEVEDCPLLRLYLEGACRWLVVGNLQAFALKAFVAPCNKASQIAGKARSLTDWKLHRVQGETGSPTEAN
eukprot:875743-Amphidinium_carterae.1